MFTYKFAIKHLTIHTVTGVGDFANVAAAAPCSRIKRALSLPTVRRNSAVMPTPHTPDCCSWGSFSYTRMYALLCGSCAVRPRTDAKLAAVTVSSSQIDQRPPNIHMLFVETDTLSRVTLLAKWLSHTVWTHTHARTHTQTSNRAYRHTRIYTQSRWLVQCAF